jgi:hypothetical protein
MRTTASRMVACAAAAVLAATLFAGSAAAHGLLQVDVLMQQDVFMPTWSVGGAYAPDPQLTNGLNRRLRRLRAAGTPMKIVLIAQKTDLQDVSEYFNLPRAYAAFLEQLLMAEHVFAGRLVIVMPNGSAEIVGSGQPRALGLRPAMKNEWDMNALMKTAIAAVDKAASEPLPAQPASVPAKKSTGTRWVLPAVLAALLLLGLLYGRLRWQRQRASTGAAGPIRPPGQPPRAVG